MLLKNWGISYSCTVNGSKLGAVVHADGHPTSSTCAYIHFKQDHKNAILAFNTLLFFFLSFFFF